MGESLSFRDRLSVTLYSRAPGDRFLFWLSPKRKPFVALEPLSRAGRAQMDAFLARMEKRGGAGGLQGLAIVRDDGSFVFCAARAPKNFLAAVAGIVEQNMAAIPALVALVGSGVATAPLDLTSGSALKRLSLSELPIRDDPELWASIDQLDEAALSSLLAAATAGQSFRYWLDPNLDQPLLMLPVALDPAGARIGRLAQGKLSRKAFVAEDWIQGRCRLGVDGVLRFDQPAPANIGRLAAWVQRRVGAAPGLARLRGAHFGGVATDPGLWDGVAPLPLDGGIAEVSAFVRGAQPSDTAWFWLSGGAPEPTMTVLPLSADPDGAAFQERAQRFSRRFPGEPMQGTLHRLSSGRFLFTTLAGAADAWAGALGALRAQHPDLGGLDGARFTRVRGGAIVEARVFQPVE